MAASRQTLTLDEITERVLEGVKSSLDIEALLDKHLVPIQEFKKGLEERLKGLETERTRLAESVLATGKAPETADQKAEKGITFARIVRSQAAGKKTGEQPIDWLCRHYGKDDRSVKALEQSVDAVTKIRELSVTLKAPQLASDLETGGVFITPEFSQDLIENLRPMSVVQSLNPMFVPLISGTTFAKKTGSTTAQYVGESSNLPKTGIATGTLRLTARELGAIVPISNQLLRFGSIAADAVVRDDLSQSIALAADLKKIRGLGTQHSPKGLRYWVAAANILDCATVSEYGTDSTPTLAELNNTFEDVIYKLEAADVKFIRPGWIWHPRIMKVLRGARDLDGRYVYRDDLMRGTFMGYPYRVTTQIPTTLGAGSDETEIYLADFADIIDAEAEGLFIDTSTEAAYIEAGVTKSAFQENSTLIRVAMLHDFGARHDESIAVATGVHWSVPPVG